MSTKSKRTRPAAEEPEMEVDVNDTPTEAVLQTVYELTIPGNSTQSAPISAIGAPIPMGVEVAPVPMGIETPVKKKTPRAKSSGSVNKRKQSQQQTETNPEENDAGEAMEVETPEPTKKVRRSNTGKPAYIPKKPRMDDVEGNVLWEAPSAPDRLSAPKTQKAKGKSTLSIGRHLLTNKPIFDSIATTYSDDTVLFPHWDCPLSTLAVVTADYEDFLPRANPSVPFQFRGAQDSDEPIKVPLFESHCIAKEGKLVDFVINAGGTIVDFDWCPRQIKPDHELDDNFSHSFMAVAAHKSTTVTYPYSSTFEGGHMIQIWDFGRMSSSETILPVDEQVKGPYMSLGILHNGECVHDLVWCPRGSPIPVDSIEGPGDEVFLPRLGLLAAVLGDGTVVVYSVPHPLVLRRLLNIEKYSTKPLIIEMRPVFCASFPNRSPASELSWSHLDQCEYLAAGSSEGNIAVWRLPTNANEQTAGSTFVLSPTVFVDPSRFGLPTPPHDINAPPPRPHNSLNSYLQEQAHVISEDPLESGEEFQPQIPLFLVPQVSIPYFFKQAHISPIRGLCWHPTCPTLLVSCAMEHMVKMWDIRYPEIAPRLMVGAGGVNTALDWSADGFCLLIGSDEGTIRHLTPNQHKTLEAHKIAPIMGIHHSRLLNMQASCDAEGFVAVLPFQDRKSKGQPLSVLIEDLTLETSANGVEFLVFAHSATQCANQRSPVLGEDEKPTTKRTPKKSASIPGNDNEPIEFPSILQMVQKAKWTPDPAAPNWLAYGGTAGLLRVQQLPWLTPP